MPRSLIITMVKISFLTFLWFFAIGSFSPSYAACTNPNRSEGALIYNHDYGVFQGCTPVGWIRFNPSPDCPKSGDPCMNGMIYAGEYDGHKLYVTAEDAPGTYTWNNEYEGDDYYPDLDNMFMPNCPWGPVRSSNRNSNQSNPACMGAQGPAFTQYLANVTDMGSPYKAASYCYHLGKASDPLGPNNPLAYGRSDWYLPAVDELEFIYDNLGPEPNSGFHSAYYWSSTEFGTGLAWLQNFYTGHQDDGYKHHSRRVRCVRR